MHFTFARLLLIATVVVISAAPVLAKTVDANFDKLKGANIVASNRAPKKYLGLNYHNFRLAIASNKSIVALKPSSLDNFIVSLPLATSGIVTRSSGTKYFDLKSLTAGCYEATENGLVAPPVACTFKFTGTKWGKKHGDKATVTQYHKFKVDSKSGIGKKSEPVQRVTFHPSGFAGLTKLEIEVAKATLPPGSTVQFALDNFRYRYVA